MGKGVAFVLSGILLVACALVSDCRGQSDVTRSADAQKSMSI